MHKISCVAKFSQVGITASCNMQDDSAQMLKQTSTMRGSLPYCDEYHKFRRMAQITDLYLTEIQQLVPTNFAVAPDLCSTQATSQAANGNDELDWLGKLGLVKAHSRTTFGRPRGSRERWSKLG